MTREKKIVGLTSAEAAERAKNGLSNVSVAPPSKSVGRIWRDNLFTFYNFLNLVLAALVISTGSYRNLLFLGVVLANFFIGTLQELRAKKTVDELSVLTAPRATAIRGGEPVSLFGEELVRGDVVLLRPGDQLLADAEVMDGRAEVSEALITGESDAIVKSGGDELFSGSFVVSGSCRAVLTRVGAESYAAKLTLEAKRDRAQTSVLKKLMTDIIKFVTVFIIPVGLLLFYNQYVVQGAAYGDAMIATAAAVLGMIPDGLYLLTSMAFAIGVIRLGRHGTLVQQLYSLESLARADVLCLDKTGTITEGSMEVQSVVPLGADEKAVERVMSELCAALPADNATGAALAREFTGGGEWSADFLLPFSSKRKLSGADFGEHGAFVMGAPEFVLAGGYEPYRDKVEALAAGGNRVLTAAAVTFSDGEPMEARPLGFIVLTDKLRPNVGETFDYFKKQGVAIKVISGDSPVAVSAIAVRAGVEGAENYVDASALSDDELAAAAENATVFGRVTPDQKRVLIKSLQRAGHTVAMTGDGVNDVLALKDADCSVAMASGADAARHVSQLVLMDSDFSAMPRVVLEGRRVINNIERAASLFLAKTVYSFSLSALHLVLPFAYPFVPIHLTLIGALTIGVPGFFLALEPNDRRVKGSFVKTVLRRVLPGAATVVAGVLMAQAFGTSLGLTAGECSTVSVIFTGLSGLMLLLCSCMPLNGLRAGLVAAMGALFAGAVLVLPGLFMLTPLHGTALTLLVCLSPLSLIQVALRWWTIRKKK